MASDPSNRAGVILEIDLVGIVANWRALAARVEPAGCAAVVKADAYGLGAAQVSTVLAAAGCRLFFVATLDEGVALRSTLPASCEIAVLNGPLPGSAQEFVLHQLVPVLNEPGQITNPHASLPCAGTSPACLQAWPRHPGFSSARGFTWISFAPVPPFMASTRCPAP